MRASYNHPYIDQAIARVVGGDVARGADPHVRTCSDYADDIGHLQDGAIAPIGRNIASFYAGEELNAATSDVDAQRTVSTPPTSTTRPVATATCHPAVSIHSNTGANSGPHKPAGRPDCSG